MDTPLLLRQGRILVYHLFAVADTIDLDHVRRLWEGQSVTTRLISRRAAPEYIQFINPPVTLALGERMLYPSPDSPMPARAGAKVFDFGVVSIRWEIDLPPTWADLVQRGPSFVDNAAIEVLSRQLLEEIRPKLSPGFCNPYRETLEEDYTIFYVESFDGGEPLSARRLFADHGADIARLIRGENKPLSPSEQAETLRQNISYFDDDLVVIDWNAALVYDREGSSEHIDILEFANCELLELRYYDALLDRELDRIYHEVEAGPASGWRYWLHNRYRPTSHRLLTLMVDVVELKDQIENSLKLIGDLYSARVYRAISERLRLKEWEASIEGKLRSARQIYEVLTDSLDIGRSVFLEWTIIILIALEIVLLFALPSH
jgi:hypothetical protein